MEDQEILSVKALKKSFGPLQVLKGVSFQVHRQGCLGILGGSGCGKSVLLRALIGLEEIDGGQIYFKGRRVDQLIEKDWIPIRQKMAFIFQSGALFDSETVFDNVAFPLWEHTKLGIQAVSEKVNNILNWVGLSSKGHLMPSELSGGMMKRVSLARALVLEPELILYDEPTSGLDPQNTRKILNIMRALKGQGMTSIVVTHDVSLASSICDSIILIDDGIVGFRGTPQEFKLENNFMVRKYLGLNGERTEETIIAGLKGESDHETSPGKNPVHCWDERLHTGANDRPVYFHPRAKDIYFRKKHLPPHPC